ncbi:hypothetical protein Patl1_25336 [Pistacia atlantica]|uniref:Uncharacterized protein n=1 Tax=Pistacia atlantica TaxID=434234 RepID=A0ACC1AYS4_9ROSI|nr:hypothetical protein Patl1_25336 [Pistacia atlantica]
MTVNTTKGTYTSRVIKSVFQRNKQLKLSSDFSGFEPAGTCNTNCTSTPVPPPKPLLIAMPTDAGDFPLLLFLHGYLLYNSFYSQLIQHVASHGFIVIAPQLYDVAGADATGEIKSAAATTNWLSEGLHGVDPVDGMDKGKQTPPPVLTYVPRSFDLDMAGDGDWFRLRDYGHLDMLDDDTKGIRGKATYCLCKNGKSREPMRMFTAGIIVAFMRAYLDGDFSDLMSIRDGHAALPVEFQTVEFLE